MSDLYLDNLNYIDPKNISYCVDMIRLSCPLNSYEFNNILKPFTLEPNAKMFENFQLDKFKHNVNYVGENCSFWFGWLSNSELLKGNASLQNPLVRHNFTCEFNPNKCRDNPFLQFVLDNMHDIKIVSVDLACDFPFDITELDFTSVNKSHKTTFDTPEGITYYFGKGDKRIKIYDKRKESNLDYDLTRIEMSVGLNILLKDSKSIDFSKLCFPIVSTSSYQTNLEDLSLNDTMKVVLFALDKGYPISHLSRRFQEKVKNYKIKKSLIEITPSHFNKTLVNYLDYYFNIKDYI